jgi:putative peptidoglycan lipid II flippase
LGLVRDRMTAQYFPNDVRDAFFNAFRLPNLFRRLLGEGSLSIAFIPIFIEILSGRDGQPKSEIEKRAKALIAGVFSITVSIAITISLIAIIFMEPIMAFLLNGEAYHSVPGKFEMTVRLGRIMFGFLIMISMYAFFMAVQNSLKKFAMTALAPCFFNIAMIAAALLSGAIGSAETVLAWAVLVGGFLQMIVLVPGVVRAGYFPRISWTWNNPDIVRVVKAVLPGIFGMSIMQATAIVNMHFTSRLPSGSQSYLYFADRIFELPFSMIVVSVGTALLPTLAKNFADGNENAMSESMNRCIRLIVFIALPAAVGMFVLAQPIVDVLFLGREFKYGDALATAQIIRIYSFSVLIAAGVRILAQGFYAIQNTWFPAVTGGVALCTHMIFAMAFTTKFGLNGLAIASLCSGGVNLFLLVTGYRAWIGTLQIRTLLKRLVKFAICAAVMTGILLTHDYFSKMAHSNFFAEAIILMFIIVVAGFAYMATANILRVPEYRDTAALLLEKLKTRKA